MARRIVKATEPQYLVSLSQNDAHPWAKPVAHRVGASRLAEHEATMRAFGWQHIAISAMAYSETLGKYVTIPE